MSESVHDEPSGRDSGVFKTHEWEFAILLGKAHRRVVGRWVHPTRNHSPERCSRREKLRISTGAYWPFLSDGDRELQRALDIREYTDPVHDATVPHTVLLQPGLVIDKIYVGYWYWGRPSPYQLWMDRQDMFRRIKPDFHPTKPEVRADLASAQLTYNQSMAITGAHVLLYTSEPEGLRNIFRDVFGFEHVDAGDGWLIFALPPAELAVHPSAGPTFDSGVRHQLTLMCDDIATTIDELRSKGVDVRGEPLDEGWGITTTLALPGGVEVMLYEPRHPTAI